ncbi:MAG: efflux RND transporter periplasmic adaptor subunit [Verrucomicrobiota bacterium]
MNAESIKSITSSPAVESEVKNNVKFNRRLASSLPMVLLLGFAVLGWFLFGDKLERRIPVEVEPVLIMRQIEESSSVSDPGLAKLANWDAPMLFQASGWIEPDPLPTKATALVNGVVSEVHVLEGERVFKGQLLAEFISEDFELDLQVAHSELDALRAEQEAHESVIAAAEAKIVTLEKQVEAGRKKCAELEDRKSRLEKAGTGAVSEETLTLARLRLETHETEVEAMSASRAELVSELTGLESRRKEFESRIRRAKTEVERRELALSRTRILSPVDGVVLRLLAVPGQKRMLEMDDIDSATIAILYEPDSLQARIDVPLEEAARLAVGQRVRLRSSFLPDRVFKGVVARVVGEADLQRNTLQAKVRVEDPDERLRPEMLCRAEFLETSLRGREPDEDKLSDRRGRIALYVPESSLLGAHRERNEVWTVSESGSRLEKREIILGGELKDGYVRVLDGLRAGDRVAIQPEAHLSEQSKIEPILKGAST